MDQTSVDEEKGKLIVVAEDMLPGKIVRIPMDMVVSYPALEARSDSDGVTKIFTLNCRADGFFMERHVKLDPVATTTEGTFSAGCCEGSKDISDTIAQASAAAASKVAGPMKMRCVKAEAINVFVNEEEYSVCGVCELLCSFQAIELQSRDDKRVSYVNALVCKSCGTCGAACPSGAISMQHFTDEQILAQVEALFS